MPPLTRDTFISPDGLKIALSKETMFMISEEGSVDEVPIPSNIKSTGIIPDDYTVDYHLDPYIVVSNLAQNGMTTTEDLPPTLLEEMRKIINGKDNVTIAPKSVVEAKRELFLASIEGGEDKENSDRN